MRVVQWIAGVLIVLAAILGGPGQVLAGGPPVQEQAPSASHWQVEFRPYAWVLFITGDSRLGASTAKVDTNLFEIIDKADELYAWMSYQEFRRGRVGLYADVFWSKINVGTSTIRSSNPIAGLAASIVADADVWFHLAILEPGITFEIANWSRGHGSLKDAYAFVPSTAIDVVAGARYWYMKPDIDLTVTATVNIPALGLTRTAGGTISAKKTIDWWDPFIGVRLRHKPALGQELMLRADVGGFDLGSDITWQAIAGYNVMTGFLGFPLTTHLGYRALYIDYEQGSGNRTFGLETLWHGPVMGATFRW